MVVNVRGGMERGPRNVIDGAHATGEHDHIGCLRKMGMRQLLVGKVVQLEWVPQWRDKPIAQKELLPIEAMIYSRSDIFSDRRLQKS